MTKNQYDDLGYSLSPQNVSKVFWYYEGKKGLTCVYQPRAATGELLFHAPSWTVPWRMLDRTFERRRNAKLIKSAKRKSK